MATIINFPGAFRQNPPVGVLTRPLADIAPFLRARPSVSVVGRLPATTILQPAAPVTPATSVYTRLLDKLGFELRRRPPANRWVGDDFVGFTHEASWYDGERRLGRTAAGEVADFFHGIPRLRLVRASYATPGGREALTTLIHADWLARFPAHIHQLLLQVTESRCASWRDSLRHGAETLIMESLRRRHCLRVIPLEELRPLFAKSVPLAIASAFCFVAYSLTTNGKQHIG